MCALLFEELKLPALVGYLLAGVTIAVILPVARLRRTGQQTALRDIADAITGERLERVKGDDALAVLEADVADLGRRTAEQGDDPQAFFWFLDRLAEDMVRNAGLAGVVRNVRSPDALTPLRQSLMEAGAAPLKRAQAAGLVREDLRPMDIRLIATLLGAGFQGADEAERQAVSLRTRALVLDGLRPRGEPR